MAHGIEAERAGTGRSLAVALAVALALGSPGCGDDAASPAPETAFEVTLARLPSLPAGKGHYEAWIAFPEPEGKSGPCDASPLHGDLELVSIGVFQVDPSGNPAGLDGNAPRWALRLERDLDLAAEAWISIEPDGDADTIPAGLLLGGDVGGTAERGVAILSTGFRRVFDLEQDPDLDTLRGTYTLEDCSGPTSATAILWWDGSDVGLNLPALDGEKVLYEGWILLPGVPLTLSTGRFRRPDSLDSDGFGVFRGDSAARPEVPGQCVLCGGPGGCLTGGDAVLLVTLEPATDNDLAAPSPFVLVADTIPRGQSMGAPVEAINVTASLPTATVVINR